jgi:hypothetical protein
MEKAKPSAKSRSTEGMARRTETLVLPIAWERGERAQDRRGENPLRTDCRAAPRLRQSGRRQVVRPGGQKTPKPSPGWWKRSERRRVSCSIPGAPNIAAPEKLGIDPASIGPGLMRAALGTAKRVARATCERRDDQSLFADAVSHAEVNRLLAPGDRRLPACPGKGRYSSRKP